MTAFLSFGLHMAVHNPISTFIFQDELFYENYSSICITTIFTTNEPFSICKRQTLIMLSFVKKKKIPARMIIWFNKTTPSAMSLLVFSAVREYLINLAFPYWNVDKPKYNFWWLALCLYDIFNNFISLDSDAAWLAEGSVHIYTNKLYCQLTAWSTKHENRFVAFEINLRPRV